MWTAMKRRQPISKFPVSYTGHPSYPLPPLSPLGLLPSCPMGEQQEQVCLCTNRPQNPLSGRLWRLTRRTRQDWRYVSVDTSQTPPFLVRLGLLKRRKSGAFSSSKIKNSWVFNHVWSQWGGQQEFGIRTEVGPCFSCFFLPLAPEYWRALRS